MFRVGPAGQGRGHRRWVGAQAVSGHPHPAPQGSLLRGQLPLFLKGFFRNSGPVVVQVMATVADALHRLGAHGAGAHSVPLALNARSFFEDVSERAGHPRTPLRPHPRGQAPERRGPPGGAAPFFPRCASSPAPLPEAARAPGVSRSPARRHAWPLGCRTWPGDSHDPTCPGWPARGAPGGAESRATWEGSPGWALGGPGRVWP